MRNKEEMSNEIVVSLLVLFIITSFTNILATLKTILISKKIMRPVYFLVFVDAIIFATVLKTVSGSSGAYFIVAYALGRTCGVFIGGKIEESLALGIIEVDLFLKNKKQMIRVADKLREEGYTVNNFRTRGINGNLTYMVEVVLRRNEFKILENILSENGVERPTLKIKNLSKVKGEFAI